MLSWGRLTRTFQIRSLSHGACPDRAPQGGIGFPQHGQVGELRHEGLVLRLRHDHPPRPVRLGMVRLDPQGAAEVSPTSALSIIHLPEPALMRIRVSFMYMLFLLQLPLGTWSAPENAQTPAVHPNTSTASNSGNCSDPTPELVQLWA